MGRIAATLLVASLSLVVALVNAAEFRLLEEVANPALEAFNSKDADDLFEFGQPAFSLYLDLREVARGADISITDPDLLTQAGDAGWEDWDQVPGLERSELIGIAGMGDVTLAAPPALEAGDVDRLLGAEVASGEFRQVGPYVVSVAAGDVDEIVVLREAGVALLVDRRLLPGTP